MCQSIRFPCFEFPNETLVKFAAIRTGDEIRMNFRKSDALLPVLHHGDNKLMEWGNKKSRGLPRTGFCKLESLEAGKWKWLNPEPVRILASSGRSNGVWFQVRQGIRGILVHDEDERAHCYMLTQPATHYFKIMTGSDRMPVLVNQIL
jgi:hypothetical protein